MKRSEAYHILNELYKNATEAQKEALSIAQDDVQMVDLMQDVTVQKKGEWKWEYIVTHGVAEKKAVCSLCGVPNKQYKPPYCPHCGAKMDGDT